MNEPQSSWEHYHRSAAAPASTDRAFCLVFATVFALLGLYAVWTGGTGWGWWLASASMLAVAVARPALAAPFNRAWTRFGLLLHTVTSPLVLGVIFFLVVTPMGWTMRRFGWDPLRRKPDRSGASYWIARTEAGMRPDGMRNQF